jgi:hypothetical protein
MVLKSKSPAIHLLGDIGQSNHDEYIRVYEEDEEYYTGNFEEGFGFVDVKFKKSDVRNLTKEEVDELNKKVFCINNQQCYNISIDDNGNFYE